MQSSTLLVYLVESGHFQRKLEFCREILAQNMNFSPAWLLHLMTKESDTTHQVSITNFTELFQMIGLELHKPQIVHIFQYFDTQNQSAVDNKVFINFLLPNIREGLKKAAMKRTPEDLQLTEDLKYALKRFFYQVLEMRKFLSQHLFRQIEDAYDDQPISATEILDFMNKFGKYPTPSEVKLISLCIVEGRLKQVTQKSIKKIIKDANELNSKLVQSMKQERVKNTLESKGYATRKKDIFQNTITQNQNHSKTEDKSKENEPSFLLSVKEPKKVAQSSFHPSSKSNKYTESVEQLKKAQQIADHLLSKEATPYTMIKENSSKRIFKPSSKILESSKSNQSFSQLEAFQTVQKNNEALRKQIYFEQEQNERRLKELRSRLRP